MKEEFLKEEIRQSLKGIPFYIRDQGGEKASNKEGHKTIFFTVKNPHDCHRIKDQWSIELQDSIYRMCPAYFGKKELQEWKKYQAEYTSFESSHSMLKVAKVLLMHNPKNLYYQSDSKIIVEFESEADLFDTCEHAIYFGQFKI